MGRAQRVVVGDCVAAMAAQLPATVDLIVTSPPYNLDLRYGVYGMARCLAVRKRRF